ncbi:oxidoreductase [Luteibacter yeojuensis]|uniref:Short-chain dehydrogenase n=1 Tax=Luteibacter yeojuensis TaxID=345309 RepID=A0A0F3L014_9GAMM|nr:oxidoreductase [Luteibacter yeojuensis]KJV35694.1 short-chain dehydrogenase [Luteibacter yeojuensis]
MLDANAVWLVTGSSSGLGLALANAVLDAGYRAVLTAREPGRLEALQAKHGDRVRVLRLDVTDAAAIVPAVREAEAAFGQVDVLVNNAGYGYLAAVEEGSDDEVRKLFETNVFSVVNMLRAVLPAMRQRKAGTVINISSLGGLLALPATGYYHATKYAIEALSESLALEAAPLGLHVLIVEPGALRTAWAGSSMAESGCVIADYAPTAGKRRETTKASSGKQPGDPARAAQAIIEAVNATEPPLRLLLGASAVDVARERFSTLKKNAEQWAWLSKTADFPEGE